MHFEFGFYSSLLLISFSQGLVFSFLLLIKGLKTERTEYYWLSAFIFLCCLYVAPWMLGFAGWYDNQPYRDILFYTPFQHLFLLGPLIFFYTQNLLNPSFRFRKTDLLHFVPGLLYIVYNLIVLIYDRWIFGGYYFYADQADKDFDSWYQTAGLVSMLFYFLASLRYYNRYRKLIFEVVSYADTIVFAWIRNYLFAFLVMLLLPFVFELAGIFYPGLQTYRGSWWFFLLFSIIMYYIAISGYSNPIHAKIGFDISLFHKRTYLLTSPSKVNSSFENTPIDIDHEEIGNELSEDLLRWREKIQELMEHEQLFMNPELTLTDISKKLQTNSAVISRSINQGFHMNFNDFVNQFRIEAVRKLLEAGEHRKSTLLGLAFDCGFNSKATFNRAFKKVTGITPKEYLRNQEIEARMPNF